MPVIKAAEFAAEWKEWWNVLQPSWRSDGSSRDCPADADWQVLQRGGNNGIFIVIMCLSWWGKAVTSPQTSEAFQAAVEDVTWTLKNVSLSISSISAGSKRAGDNLDIRSSNKRMRK